MRRKTDFLEKKIVARMIHCSLRIFIKIKIFELNEFPSKIISLND